MRYKGRGAAFYVPAEKEVLDRLEAEDLTILEGRKLRFECVRVHGDNQSVIVPSASITGAAVGESAQGKTTAHKAGGSGGMESVWGRTPSGPRELAEAGDVVYAEANGPHRAPRRCGTICEIPCQDLRTFGGIWCLLSGSLNLFFALSSVYYNN